MCSVTTRWFVYILRCSDSTLYTGVTTDIERRLDQHNGLLDGGARYTRSRRPVKLVFIEPSPDKSTAFKREFEIKSMRQSQKLYLIEQTNSDRK